MQSPTHRPAAVPVPPDDILIEPLPVEGEDFLSLPQLVREHAVRRATEVALRDDERQWTWAELSRDVDRMAAALAAAGLRPGDALAILAETDGWYLLAMLAGLAAGGCVAPLPVMATDETLARLLADSQAPLLVASPGYAQRAEAVLALLPVAERPRALSLAAPRDGWATLDPRGPGPWPAPPAVAVGPQDGFNIIYSSGTTGTPKGIVHDHRFRSRQLRRMREFGIDEHSRYLVCTPMYSNTTLVAAFAVVGNGGSLTVMRRFEAGAYLRRIEELGITHVTLVPVLCQRLMAHPGLREHDLSSLRSTTITSSPLGASVKHQLLDHWPGAIYEMYGLTEGGLTTALDLRRFPHKLATVGKPSPTAVVRIIDEQGRDVAPGEVGEVIGRSIAMMSGYHRRPDLTRAILHRHADGHHYILTGDLGRFDADGFLHIVGRRKDVIISGGFNLYAVDLEDEMLRHPDVLEAAVVGVPSAEWGETPVGIAVLKPGARATAAELRDFVNARVGRNQRLKEVRLAGELPRNAVGKVLKDRLREQASAQEAGT